MLSTLKENKLSSLILSMSVTLFLLFPEVTYAAQTTNQVRNRLRTGITAFQTVLTGLVVVVGIVAALKIVTKHLPGIDDPHVKNEMWKSLANVGYAVAAGAAFVWIIPWIYSLFT